MSVIQLHERVPSSLESAAASINRHIAVYCKAEGAAYEHRLRAGKELIAIRPEVESAGFGWEKWCKTNILRSMGDIRKLMKLARADDPEEAVKEERTGVRDQVRRHRANRAYVCAVDVEQLILDFEGLNEEDKIKFMTRTGLERRRQ